MYTVPNPNPNPFPPPAITSVVNGEARCFADPSGYSYPAPSTRVELYDRSPVPVTGRALLASEMTDAQGKFSVVVQGVDLRRIDWALRLTNLGTRETHTKESRMVLASPSVVWPMPNLVHITFDAGTILLPWNPQLGVLARVGGRGFVYHTDLAAALAHGLRHAAGTVSLLREISPDQPDRDLDLDRMFTALEAQAASGSTGLVDRVMAEANSLLKVNPFKFVGAAEFFPQALQQIAMMSVRQVKARAFGMELGKAMHKAFGASMPASFLDLLQVPGVAAGCALLHAAGHVAKGHRMTINFSGPEPVSIPRLKPYYRYCHVSEIVTA